MTLPSSSSGHPMHSALRAVIMPTFAALMVLSLVSIWPMQQKRERQDKEEQVMIIQGDVAYWSIGTDTKRHLSVGDREESASDMDATSQ